eukprot:3043877-Amphidinium_carterae.2
MSTSSIWTATTQHTAVMERLFTEDQGWLQSPAKTFCLHLAQQLAIGIVLTQLENTQKAVRL